MTPEEENAQNREKGPRHYKVLKDTPYWKAGVILEGNDDYGSVSYGAYDDHMDNLVNGKKLQRPFYMDQDIIEHAPEWFKRVYLKPEYTSERIKESIGNMFTDLKGEI